MAAFPRLTPLGLLFLVMVVPLQAVAQNQIGVDLNNPEIYNKSLRALMMLFVAAVLIESALAVVFNWRVFLTYFSLRGVKTLISVAVSYLVVVTFGIDVVGELLELYVAQVGESGVVSEILTALILAGGSSGINNLMIKLGYRSPEREEKVAPKAPPTQAWISLKIKRQEAVGPVQVSVTEVPAPTPLPSAIAGTVGLGRPSLKDLLLRNPDRFPANGGYVLEPGKVYQIDAKGCKADGTAVTDKSLTGPYRFAPGAIVDFEATL